MKKRILGTLIILLVCMQLCTVNSYAEENSPIYINSDNFAEQSGNTVYFKKSSYDFRISSLKDSLKEKAVLYPDTISGDYFVSAGWIYYINYQDQKLYRVKADGNGRMKLSDSAVVVSDVKDGYIYYKDGNGSNTLFRMKTDGTGKKNIADCSGFLIKDNWIYYIDNESSKLYKANADGTGRKKLSDTAVKSFIDVIGDWIYFKDHSSFVCRIKINGASETRLSEECASTVKISDNWIYYNTFSSNSWTGSVTYGSLYKVKTDGSGFSTVVSGSITTIDYVGNGWIYYEEFNSKVYTEASSTMYCDIYKVKTDGSSKTSVKELVYGKSNGYLYYKNITDNKLYRKNMKTSKTAKVLDINVNSLKFDGDRVFYCDSMTDNYLYQLGADGKSKKVMDVQVNAAYISNGNVYYENLDDQNKLYKTKMGDTGMVKLTDFTVKIAAVSDSWIYYYSEDLCLYRVGTNGKKNEAIYTPTSYGEFLKEFWVRDGYCYYWCQDNKLYRQKEGSSNLKMIAEGVFNKPLMGDGVIYFYNSFEDTVYQLDLNSLEIQVAAEITGYFTDFIGLYDSKLYYSDVTDNKICRIDLNTSTQENVCSCLTNAVLSDGKLYGLKKVSEIDASLYKIDLKGLSEEEIISSDIAKMDAAGGYIFYQSPAYSSKCVFNFIKAD